MQFLARVCQGRADLPPNFGLGQVRRHFCTLKERTDDLVAVQNLTLRRVSIAFSLVYPQADSAYFH